MDEQKWQELEEKIDRLENNVNAKFDGIQASWDKATDISTNKWGAVFLRVCEWVLIFILVYQLFFR